MFYAKRLWHFILRKRHVPSNPVPAQPKRHPTKCFTPYLNGIDTDIVEGEAGSALFINKATGAPVLWASGTLQKMPDDIRQKFALATKNMDSDAK